MSVELSYSGDGNRTDWCAPLSEGELRCPEKDGNIISAGRCVATTECPRAATCSLRAPAIKLVKWALKPGGKGPSWVAPGAKKIAPHDCKNCGTEIRTTRETLCSKACKQKYRQWLDAASKGLISRSGSVPDQSGYLYGRGQKKITSKEQP